MKTLYIECSMGAAGDMLTAALLELCESQKFIDRMNSLNLPDVEISAQKIKKCGISGTQMTVSVSGTEEESHDVHTHEHNHSRHHEHHHEHSHSEYQHHENQHEHAHHEHHHSHTGMQKIESLVNSLQISDKVKSDVLGVYRSIAEAEAYVHGSATDEIHFHEVGTMDAVADIVGVCLLMEEISPDKVVISPVNVGSGHVRCTHGILPVPAPATAYLLRGILSYSSSIEGELCTPTGAALLRYFSSESGNMPVMKTEKTGYGFGKKDFSILNCVRTFLGETENEPEQILELKCNLDDMTAENIGFASDMLFKAGALDVFTSPIGMKKNRPAVLLTCLCRPEQREVMVHEIFRHTSTIGIRETLCGRYVLDRTETVRKTEYGDVRIKNAGGYGVSRSKPEYDDIANIARDNNLTLDEVISKL